MEFDSEVRVSATLQPGKASREIGHLAVWRVSTAKPGNGVDLLRDGRDDTYWQSDGVQPHTVILEFQKRVSLSGLAIQTDYKLDESYTPQRISIRAGSCWSDVQEIKALDLHEPQGWAYIPLINATTEQPFHGGVWILQVAVLANHQNGRDTHIRQMQVFGPRVDLVKSLGYEVGFTTPEVSMYATVR